MEYIYKPCLDKNCGHCCNPVRVDVKEQGEPPKDKNGKTIFISRNEILVPETHPDTVRLKTYDCINFDQESKICLDRKNRPDLCRRSSCIHDINGDIDAQYRKTVDEKFIVIHRNKP